MDNDEIVGQSAVAEDTQADFEVRLRKDLQKEYDSRLENEVLKISHRMQEENKKVIAEALENYRKQMVPPTENDIQKLLDQEYVEFKVKLRVPSKGGEERYVDKTFTIKELPQKLEKKILKRAKDVMVPFSQDIAALSFKVLEGDASEKLVQLMNTFEPFLDLMCDICAIVLNPYDEEEDIDTEWVKENVSSTRIFKILNAQFEVNKMRDFFSLLFQGSKLLR